MTREFTLSKATAAALGGGGPDDAGLLPRGPFVALLTGDARSGRFEAKPVLGYGLEFWTGDHRWPDGILLIVDEYDDSLTMEVHRIAEVAERAAVEATGRWVTGPLRGPGQVTIRPVTLNDAAWIRDGAFKDVTTLEELMANL